MIGDSITMDGNWNDIFPDVKIANRGIGNYRTYDVLLCIDNIISIKPKKAFIMLGVNDLLVGREVDDVLSDYKKIITSLQRHKIQIFVQSIFECSRSNCGEILESIRIFNEKLKNFCEEKNITFINLNKELTSISEGLLKEYTYDGIHLRGIGYVNWQQIIAPYIYSN